MLRTVKIAIICLVIIFVYSPSSAVEVISERDLKRAGIGWGYYHGHFRLRCPYQGEGHTISFSQNFYNLYMFPVSNHETY